MKQNDKVWLSVEDLEGNPALREQSKDEFFKLPMLNDLADDEVVTSKSVGTARRDFLKYLGFSLGAATIAAACDTPVRKALPYVTKPDTIVPGIATYYASSYVRNGEFCPILVKTREGRPIKIEGNTMSPLTYGGTSARVQASVLDLYDVARLKEPRKTEGKNRNPDWDSIDSEIMSKLKAARNIRIISNTNISPSFKSALKKFQNTYSQTKLITYDPISSSAMLLANKQTFGKQEIPGIRFDKADVIVSFGADFLGTWISPTTFAHQYGKRRKVKGKKADHVLRFVAFESNMSYTGSNADNRVLIKPSEQGLAIATLYNLIARKSGLASMSLSGNLSNPKADPALETVAEDLWAAKGASLVVSNSNNTSEQSLINAINHALENYGKTLDFNHSIYQKQGIDREMADFLGELKRGAVDVVITLGDANPVHDHPMGADFATALSQVGTRIACTDMPSETQDLCNYTCPAPHYLESWGDANPVKGYYAIQQPTIHSLFDTRPVQISLMTWSDQMPEAGEEDALYSLLKTDWEQKVFSQQSEYATFQAFWDSALHDGFVLVEGEAETTEFNFNISAAANITPPASSELEILFYEPLGIGAGAQANNPWLQEMPDPVTRTVWDNVLHVPIRWDGRKKFVGFQNLNEDGLLVDLSVADQTLRLPIVRQFGQMQGTIAVALGYGRKVTGKAGRGVGVMVTPMLSADADGNIQYFVTQAIVSGKKGKDDRFASVQHHHTLGIQGPDETKGGEIINVDEKAVMTLGSGMQGGLTKRTIFRHANVNHLEQGIEDLKHERENAQHLNEQTLYPDYGEIYGAGHHWGMSVDLSACIGCGACQVACVAENNVPIVGKKEVNRHHEMTWMRIDRYYYGDVDSPQVVYQPMMCQHCDNAPCENVCPVAATNHSSEGLNQMAYNRCVGTRYCANNCPYKVRRFNWLDYVTADLFPVNENDPFDEDIPYYADNLTRMVLNPDVTVRSRGVIEKCSMCVQRIQEGKLTAKKENRVLADGDIKTACQTACPTGAIVFGDMNDKKSEVSHLLHDPKSYRVLEETNVRSSIGYMMKVTNKNEKINSDEA